MRLNQRLQLLPFPLDLMCLHPDPMCLDQRPQLLLLHRDLLDLPSVLLVSTHLQILLLLAQVSTPLREVLPPVWLTQIWLLCQLWDICTRL